jgi:hypothetical protein
MVMMKGREKMASRRINRMTTLVLMAIVALLPLSGFAQNEQAKIVSYDKEVKPALESVILVKGEEWNGRMNYFPAPADSPQPSAHALLPWQAGLAMEMGEAIDLYKVHENKLFEQALKAVPDGEGRLPKLEAEFRRLILSDDLIMKAAAPRLEKVLKSNGLHCDGCPAVPNEAPKSVPLDVLMPYLTAFVWPNAIMPNGGVNLHICVGINGLDKLEKPDPILTEAAFHCLFGNQEVSEISVNAMRDAMHKDAYKALDGNDAKLRFLQKYLAETLPKDKDFLAAVKKSALSVLPLYGLSCSDCGGTP